MKRFLTVCLLLSCLVCVACQTDDNITFGKALVTAGPHTLHVELAQTPPQQQRGLMFRETLPPDSGMLFLFSPPKQVVMWMKNTLIPLDMVFINPQGRVIYIEENTTPKSLRRIYAGALTAAVLELPAGGAKRHNITPGDTLSWTILLPETQN